MRDKSYANVGAEKKMVRKKNDSEIGNEVYQKVSVQA